MWSTILLALLLSAWNDEMVVNRSTVFYRFARGIDSNRKSPSSSAMKALIAGPVLAPRNDVTTATTSLDALKNVTAFYWRLVPVPFLSASLYVSKRGAY